MGTEPFLISSSVLGMVAQRLVRTICPNCKEPYTPDEALLRGIEVAEKINGTTLWRGRGCEHCRLSGYRGRTAIYEILLMRDDIRELTQTRRPASEIKAAARKQGMRTLREAGWQKAKQGVTTVEEILRVTQDEEHDV
jgi:type II secretory ATPase GspE/PulE/Tfp pilus assembly ATPase PilB-like protein